MIFDGSGIPLFTPRRHDEAPAMSAAEDGRTFMTPHHQHAQAALAVLATIKHSDTDLEQILQQVATLAQQTIPGAGEVSITLVPERSPYTAAFTGDLALQLDEWQYRLHGGPCLQAAADADVVVIPDTTAEKRWPQWAARAASAGAGSVLSVGLTIDDSVSGALNTYGRRPHAFPDAAADIARYVAVALANAHLYYRATELAEGLSTAMTTRAVIEQAKGIVMAERHCSPDEAFALLPKISQVSNRKLRDVAADIVARVQRHTPPTGR
ncbi:GAF and ANTAR domain-containing protein [Actinoplanes sp. NPDC048796]|uniref:GAF and ANTAR domain-containing protein n=1 Tax=Actinoplanes sp. NPDC048796 TaxID=3155640 RepID=UPI0033D86F60